MGQSGRKKIIGLGFRKKNRVEKKFQKLDGVEKKIGQKKNTRQKKSLKNWMEAEKKFKKLDGGRKKV